MLVAGPKGVARPAGLRISAMRVDLLTREYPPFVYGGAGVHVEELARVLRNLVELRVEASAGPRTPG